MRSKKAMINIISSLVLQIFGIINGFIIPRLIITKFGSNVNGLIVSITQFLSYIVLLESGFGPVVKAALYKPIANKDKNQIQNILKASEKFFRMIALIFVIYIIILSIIYPLIINTEFAFLYTMSLILIISISILVEYYFGITYTLYLQAEQKKYVTSIIQIIGYIISIIAVIILIKLNSNIHIIKLICGLVFVLRPIAQNLYVKKKYKINLKEADKTYKIKQKWDGLAQHIAYVIHSNTDIVILTIFLPIVEVSVYSVYYLVVKGIKAIVEALTSGIDASFGDMIAKGENENLNKTFKLYEIFYYTITTIIYVCTIILIVPFIRVYTLGITDTNYIRNAFGILIVLGEFVWAIRVPYSDIIYAAGHFKETRKGAWIEVIVNIIISVALVHKLGITGVAIGTLIAMTIRSIDIIYHTNKYILKRKHIESIKKIMIIVIQSIFIFTISSIIPRFEINSYFSWMIFACIITVITILIIVPTNLVIYKNESKQLLEILKKNFKSKRKTI